MPSALQLCEAVENQLRQSSQARPPVQRRADNSAQTQTQEEQESIWHYLEREEVRALGLIVERWSKGRLDGLTARQLFQSQVLRGQSQQAVEFQNAGSAFLRAGLDGALAGIAMGSMVSPPGADGRARSGSAQPPGRPPTMDSQTHYHVYPNAQSQGVHISPVMPAALRAFADNPRGGMPGNSSSSTTTINIGPGGPLGGMPGGSSSSTTTINIGPQAIFGSLAGHLFGGLAAGVMGGARAGARTQTVFTAIDQIFLHSTWEDVFRVAMQELGLDGPRPLPGEVRVSFQQKAKVIIESAARQQAAYESWLDLVLLCLCVEVIRRAPTEATSIVAGSSTEIVPPPTASSPGRSAPSQAPRLIPRTETTATSSRLPPGVSMTVNDVTINSANDVTFHRHFIMGPGGTPGHMDMVFGPDPNGIRSGGAPGDNTAPFRLDRDFLRDRVFVLMETLLGGPGGPLGSSGRPAGLTTEEMDSHCPVASRKSVNGNDSCPICLEPCVIGEPIRCLPCKHELHKECCEAWLATADTCPTCRHQVPRAPRT